MAPAAPLAPPAASPSATTAACTSTASVKLPLKEVDHEYPHYPDAAKKKRLEGTCVVRYTVGKNGRVIDVAILDHAADPMFDEETLNTIRSWRYRPMMVDGKPVEVVHEVEVNYQYVVR